MRYDIGILDESERFDHTPSNLAKSLFFYPICVGEYYCEKGYSLQRSHFIDSILMMYTVDGRGTIAYRNKTYVAEAGDVVLIDCSQPHAYKTEDSWHIIWIHFHGNASKGFYDLITGRSGNAIRTQGNPLIRQLLDAILGEFRASRQISEPLVSCHVNSILTELTMLPGDADNPCTSGLHVQAAIAYIESNYARKLSISRLASQINVSVFHLTRLFKKETGYAPYEFVLKTRIDAAKALLRIEKRSVKEVAFAVGFGCEHSFIAMFEKIVGMTPKTFKDARY